MKNMGSVIPSHNKQILNPSKEHFRHNCRPRDEFPWNNKCFTPNIMYEANDECKTYIGASETSFNE